MTQTSACSETLLPAPPGGPLLPVSRDIYGRNEQGRRPTFSGRPSSNTPVALCTVEDLWDLTPCNPFETRN